MFGKAVCDYFTVGSGYTFVVPSIIGLKFGVEGFVVVRGGMFDGCVGVEVRIYY